jgi:hypothetical protein
VGRYGRLHPSEGGERHLREPLLNRRPVALLLLFSLLFSLQGLSAEESAEAEPVPYEDEEFPGWAHDLRRFEVIAFGAFPLTYILGSLTFEIVQGTKGNSDQFSLYSEKGQDDLEMLLITSAGISLCVAAADFIIGRVKEKNKEKAERGYSYARPGDYSE